MQELPKTKICIIGAGPRGLVTARHLSTIENAEVTVFEAKEDVGGLWFYKDISPTDPQFEEKKEMDNYHRLYNCFFNSMYEDLVTNLPYFFMEYKDLSMVEVDPNVPMFLPVKNYKKYLDAYASKFELKRHIKFNTLVKSVRLYKNLSEEEKSEAEEPRKFIVKTADSVADSLLSNEKCYSFDHIIVTCGQYSRPYFPEIPNLENFKGNIVHCKDFRTVESDVFKNKKVLLVGGGPSAIDMLVQFFPLDNQEEICEQVILASRAVAHIRTSEEFKNVLESGKLVLHQGSLEKVIGENTVSLTDGSEHQVDTLVFATGFKFTFPFFDLEKDKIILHNENEHRGAFFGPTYKKFIAINEPDVFFIGFLEQTTVIHILPELQAIAAKYIIEGKLKVPSQEEMRRSWEEEVEEHRDAVGDLAHFYKTNLSGSFPKLQNNSELNEWIFFSEWLKPIHPNNNEEKAKKFMDHINKARTTLWGRLKAGQFLGLKKRQDYNDFYPRDFTNTSDFV